MRTKTETSTLSVPYVGLIQQHAAIKSELLQAVERVITHSQFILGEEVASFESEFAAYCHARYAVGVSDGTAALVLALRALGIGPQDEVITVPNSFLASAACIAMVGAKPVFVDVGDDYNIDPNLIERAVTPRTRAILPVHLTGRPADMKPILDLAEIHGLAVIEDAAQAAGAEYHGQRVGSFGDIGCFSLHPLKNLGACGDAGIITTNDESIYGYLLKARNHGLKNRDESEFWSANNRLDELQAAILRVKFKHLDAWTQAVRTVAGFYQEQLREIVTVPEDKPYEYNVYHTFVVQVQRREELVKFLMESGVETAIHYPIPIHIQQASRDLRHQSGDFPVTERQAGRILSLPIYPDLTSRQTAAVVTVIHEFYA